jgi:alpha-ketoglutarate-dependent taurine dioxygenase
MLAMTPFYPYVVDRRAWIGGDLPDKEDWVVRLSLSAAHRLTERVDALAERRRPIDACERRRLFDAELTAALAAAFAEIRDGRGFAVLRGFPVDGVQMETLKLVLSELGSRLVGGQSQGELANVASAAAEEGSKTRHAAGDGQLCFHTNVCDIVALMAVRAARLGGDSSVASAFAVHNLFLRERPDLLPALYRGARNHRRGAGPYGAATNAARRVPVFSIAKRALSVRYAPPYLANDFGVADDGDLQLVEAMDALERYGERVKTTFRLEPGEVLLLNNLTTLHARSRFEDWSEADSKRLLLRLTLNAKGFRPIDPRLYSSATAHGSPAIGGHALLRESAA